MSDETNIETIVNARLISKNWTFFRTRDSNIPYVYLGNPGLELGYQVRIVTRRPGTLRSKGTKSKKAVTVVEGMIVFYSTSSHETEMQGCTSLMAPEPQYLH